MASGKDKNAKRGPDTNRGGVGKSYREHHAVNDSATPTPTDPQFDGPKSSVGQGYPAHFFTNPWNVGIDGLVGYDEDDRILRSPTKTPLAMEAISVNEESSYDSNWEYGVRGKLYDPPGPKSPTRWTPKGGK
jgi:hypothetical protein